MLVAPTGVAAFNIDSLTIHYAFRLPVEHNNLTKYTKLSAERLQQLRLLCIVWSVRVHPPTTHINQRN